MQLWPKLSIIIRDNYSQSFPFVPPRQTHPALDTSHSGTHRIHGWGEGSNQPAVSSSTSARVRSNAENAVQGHSGIHYLCMKSINAFVGICCCSSLPTWDYFHLLHTALSGIWSVTVFVVLSTLQHATNVLSTCHYLLSTCLHLLTMPI